MEEDFARIANLKALLFEFVKNVVANRKDATPEELQALPKVASLLWEILSSS